MRDLQVFSLERRCQDVRSIESEAKALHYFVDDECRGIAISGRSGIVGLTIEQAKAVCNELPEILRGMGYDYERVYPEF